MPNQKMYQGLNMNSNAVTGLPAPTNASDAATRQFVLDNAAPVTSVNTKTNAVVLVASDIGITDTAGNFTTDTVQGAIDELFTSANNGKTSIASAIGSPAEATNTFAQLATHVTTGKGQIATATGNATVSSSSTFTQLADAVSALNSKIYGVQKEVTFDETIAKDDIVESYYKSLSLVRQTQPALVPEGNANGVAWSADGKLFAVAHATTPFLSIFNYDDSTNTFTDFANPSSGAAGVSSPFMPSNTGNGVDFSPNGDYLAVAHNSSPFCTVYRKNGASFVKLPSLLSLGNNGRAVSFSADSNFLSVGTSGGFYVYSRSGETFTKIANATLEGQGTTGGTAWSPDSRYTAAAQGATPFIKFIRRDGEGASSTLTRVSTSEALDGSGNAAAWSPDGVYVAIAYSGTVGTFGANKIAIYKQSGDTFTRLTVTGQPTTSAGPTGVAWSKDGKYVYLTLGGSPSFLTIKRTGDAFAFQTNPTAPFGTISNSVDVHPNNNIITVGHDLNSFVTHYQNDGVYLFTKANTDVINPLDKIIGIAKEAGTQGQSKRVDVLVGRSLLP